MMDATTIIRKPLITEKATEHASEFNRYAFDVDRRATKDQIRRAIQELYAVRVLGVATMNRKGRMRKSRHGYWKTGAVKRAIVKIHPEDRIELF